MTKHWSESDTEDAAQAVLDAYGGIKAFQEARGLDVAGVVNAATREELSVVVQQWLDCDHLYLEHVPGCVRCGKP